MGGSAPGAERRLRAALATLPEAPCYRVALSGGPDSCALVHALARWGAGRGAARVAAVHVDHGLATGAGAWTEHCRRLCEGLGVELAVVRVEARAGAGESPEAAARRARYTALAARLEPGEVLCTAHHRDDQAETVLLQLLRGAGPRGLAAMPALRPFGRGWLARPLLAVPRRVLAAYLAGTGIEAVDDESNRDCAFDRNYLRNEVLPLLERRWPGLSRALLRATRLQREAAGLLEAQARADLERARGQADATLDAGRLRALGRPRAALVVRRWIAERGLPPPAAAHLDQILGALLAARPDARPAVRWPGGEVRRHRGELYALAPAVPPESGLRLAWRPPARLVLPDRTELTVRPVEGRGMARQRLQGRVLEVVLRSGGERVRLPGAVHRRPLKELLREAGMPPWLRARVPLVCLDGELVAVPGVCVGARLAAGPGEPGWLPAWSGWPGPAKPTGPRGGLSDHGGA